MGYLYRDVFLTRACFFMIWPFITILMRNNYAMTPVEIGVMMSVSLIVSISFGYLFGGASDKYGRRTLIILGAIAAIISFSVTCVGQLTGVVFCRYFTQWHFALIDRTRQQSGDRRYSP